MGTTLISKSTESPRMPSYSLLIIHIPQWATNLQHLSHFSTDFTKSLWVNFWNGKKKWLPRSHHKRYSNKTREEKRLETLDDFEQRNQRNNQEKRGNRMLALNFYPPLTDKIMKVSRKHGISSFYTSRGTLEEHLVNLKDGGKVRDLWDNLCNLQ